MSGQCVKSWPHEESRCSTNNHSLWIYISTVYFHDNLTKIEAVVMHGICTCDHPENVWDFPFAIYMDILNEFYIAPIQCLCMHVDDSDKAIRDAIENDLCINSSVL